MNAISSSVLKKGKPRFNMVGQKLPDSLHDTDQAISAGLLHRLFRYGRTRMSECGFEVGDWSCETYTMDGDLPLSERYYCVEFTNKSGGMLGVQGIAIGRGGHPILDHGLCIGEGRAALHKDRSDV